MTLEPDYDGCLSCICVDCELVFYLTADTEVDDVSTYVKIRSCESGGIYAMYVECPYCKHRHDLM